MILISESRSQVTSSGDTADRFHITARVRLFVVWRKPKLQESINHSSTVFHGTVSDVPIDTRSMVLESHPFSILRIH
jgi:hypothetical protein